MELESLVEGVECAQALYSKEELLQICREHVIRVGLCGRNTKYTPLDVSRIPPIIGDKFASAQLYNGFGVPKQREQTSHCETGKAVPSPADMLPFVNLISAGKLDVISLRSAEGSLKHSELHEIVKSINQDAANEIKSAAGLRAWLLQLYDLVLGGCAECHIFQKAAQATGGVLEGCCPHGFKLAHMHLFSTESVRHVSAVLRSFNIFPRIVIYDASCGLATHMDGVHHAETWRLWGRNRGCFSEWRKEGPAHVGLCPIPALSSQRRRLALNDTTLRKIAKEMLDARGGRRLDPHPFSFEFVYRLLLTDRFHHRLTAFTHKQNSCLQHLMELCPDLSDIGTSMMESLNKQANRHLRSLTNTDAEHHILYTCLLRTWHNTKVVEALIHDLHRDLTDGEMLATDDVFGVMKAVCKACGTAGHSAGDCPSGQHL